MLDPTAAVAASLLLLLLATTATAAPVADPLTVYGGGNGFTMEATVMGLGRSNGGCLVANPKSGSVQPVGIKSCGPGALLFVYDKKSQSLQVRADPPYTPAGVAGGCLTDFGSTKTKPGQAVIAACSKPVGPTQAWFMVRKLPAPTDGREPMAYLRSKSGLCLAYDEPKGLLVGVKCGAKNELEFGL